MNKKHVLLFVGLYLLLGFVYWKMKADKVLRPIPTMLMWPYLLGKTELAK